LSGPGRLAALCCALAALVAAPSALAHEGDPRYRSQVTGVEPAIQGVEVRVLNYDDSLELVNRSGRLILVEGYDGEPYARLLPDGVVQLNDRSPARFLNDERYADAPPPASASATAVPRWRTVGRDGRLAWHDHRMHWMGRGRPPAVTDPQARTKVFDYEVPLRVDGRPAVIAGTLWWAGEPDGSMPGWAVAALLAAAIASIAAVVLRTAPRQDRDPFTDP
jgi:hypothetical protein